MSEDRKVLSLVREAREPDEDIVAMCRKLLQRAEAGQVLGLAASIQYTESTERPLYMLIGCNPASLYFGLSLLRRDIENHRLECEEEQGAS
jgi:hypothetical protein